MSNDEHLKYAQVKMSKLMSELASIFKEPTKITVLVRIPKFDVALLASDDDPKIAGKAILESKGWDNRKVVLPDESADPGVA